MNDPSPAYQAALDTALSIVQEPSKPPPAVEVRYVDPNGDIADDRYLIILFRSVGFLVDNDTDQTRTFPLDVPVRTGPDGERQVLAVAKDLAVRHGLQVVYFPKPAP